MRDDAAEQELRERLWRRPLTPAEEVGLRSVLGQPPQAQQDWEADQLLSTGLARLPQTPVPTNFTARVLRAIEREQRAAHRSRGLSWRIWTWRWLPRAAVAAVVVSAGLVSYREVNEAQHRTQVADSVRAVSAAGVKVIPSPNILENFDDILAMDRAVAPDEDLLKALQ